MVKARIVLKSPKDFDDAVLQAVAKKFSQKRSEIDKAVQEQIGVAIEENRDLFKPDRGPNGSDDVVGQLGIGFGGRPDSDKIDNAYKLLKPGSSSAKLSLSFQRRNATFGIAKYTLNVEKFYAADLTNYLPSKSAFGAVNFNGPVPWMKHFIEGLEVQGYDYIDSGDSLFRSERSRTGIGLMIKIPTHTFTFRGVGADSTFSILFEKIARKLQTRPFLKKIEDIMRR